MSRIYLNNKNNGKKYKAEVSLGSGKSRKRKTKTFDSMENAKKWINQLTFEIDNGTNFEKSNWPFVDYYKHWVELYKAPMVSLATTRTYFNSYDKFKEYFGNTKIGQLTRARIQQFLNQMDMSSESIRKHLTHLRACLKDAYLDGTIPKNPAAGKLYINADPLLTKEDEKKFMSISEYKVIRDFLIRYPHNFRHINWVALMIISQTALRVGECLALKYNDFNFEKNTIRVDESFNSTDKIITEPKTKNANRTIHVPEQTMVIIHKWISYYRKELFKRGIKNPDNLILLNRLGKLPGAANINSSYHQLQIKLGFTPTFSTHTFRHTIASILLAKGDVSITYVSRYLGHSSVAITQKYYIGLLPEQEEIEASKALEAISK